MSRDFRSAPLFTVSAQLSAPLHAPVLRTPFGTISGTADDETWEMNRLGATGRYTLSGGDGNDALTLNFRSLGAAVAFDTEMDMMDPFAPILEVVSCAGVELVLSDDIEFMRFVMGNHANVLGSNDWSFRVEMIGAASADQFWSGDGDDLLRTGAGDDMVMSADGADTITAGAGNDTVYAGAGDDSLRGGEGADSLLGHTGADQIWCGSGNDTVDAGADDDLVYGLAGSDSITGGDGADQLMGGADADWIDGGAGADSLLGGTDADTILGGAGADTIIGATGADSLSGGDDADEINGGADLDTLLGEAGNDTLYGGAGDDILSGGLDNDILTGGIGADTFVFSNAMMELQFDQILDYVAADGDVIEITNPMTHHGFLMVSSGIIPGFGSDMIADVEIRDMMTMNIVCILTDTALPASILVNVNGMTLDIMP